MSAGRPREFDYDKALDQAMHVFWSKGFEGTSMPDLTDAMGMNRPSIYAAFGNKEELFRKSLDRYTQMATASLEELLDVPTVRGAIERFLMKSAESMSCTETPRGCFSVQGALVGSDDSDVVRKQALDRREATVNILDKRIRKGVTDGELPADTDTKELARFYTAVMQGMSVQSVGNRCCGDLKSIATLALNALPRA